MIASGRVGRRRYRFRSGFRGEGDRGCGAPSYTVADEVVAEVLPQGKVDAVRKLKAEHGRLAFVGDGINDAPALAEADVGLAIGTGTDVAIEAADVVLMSGSLQGVPNAIALSKATLRNIQQNLFWAFAYNTALIPVAAGALWPSFGVLLSPIFAAGAMALSDVHMLRFIRRARDLGFSVEGIGELVGLWRDRSRQSGDVKRLALSHVDDLRRKIGELEEMAATLETLAAHCHGDHRPDCPILHDLQAAAPEPTTPSKRPGAVARRHGRGDPGAVRRTASSRVIGRFGPSV